MRVFLTVTLFLAVTLGLAAQVGQLSIPQNLYSSQPRKVASRTVDIPHHFYIVEYDYDSGSATVPLTWPAGQSHYSAKISVFEVVDGEKRLLDKPFDGEYT